jgi:hypothetical protein
LTVANAACAPLHRAVRPALLRGARPLGFDPRSLFAANEQGAWFDPSDFERYITAKGPELVVNGNFASSAGWAPGTGWVVTEGVATATATAGGAILRDVGAIPGRAYSVTFTVLSITSGTFKGRVGGVSGSVNATAPGTYTEVIIATGPSVTGGVVGVNPTTGSVTNISIRELTALDTASLYQDSAGTLPVTAVEQPVGLMLDKRLGLVRGAGLCTNGSFADAAGWTLPSGWSVSGGTLKKPGIEATSATWTAGLATGKTYEVTFNLISTGGMNVQFGGAFIGPGAGAGPKRVIGTITGGTAVIGFQGGNAIEVDNVSIREIPGNHASQATAAARPVLSARKNQLLPSGDFTNVAWNKFGSSVANGGAVVTLANDPQSRVEQAKVMPVGTTVTVSAMLSGNGPVRFGIMDNGGAFPSTLQAITLTPTPTLYTVTRTISDAAAAGPIFVVRAAAVPTGPVTVAIDNAQLEYGPTATRYQRVNTATDYDWQGFPLYLKFDGVDDGLQTAPIDFSATNKMTIVAGVHKASDAAIAVVCEFGISATDPGSFAIFAPVTIAANYGFRSTGTVGVTTGPGGYAAPATHVLSMATDIGAPLLRPRINGVVTSPQFVSQGTGNYGVFPLVIGKRSATTLPLNGRIYGLSVRGAATTDAHMAAFERYIAARTGVTL